MAYFTNVTFYKFFTMNNNSDYIQVYTTLPSKKIALSLARLLTENRLIACAQIGQEILSVYTWQGTTEETYEVPLVCKTIKSRYEQLEKKILAEHPYETPEILVCEYIGGSSGYLKWVSNQTSNR